MLAVACASYNQGAAHVATRFVGIAISQQTGQAVQRRIRQHHRGGEREEKSCFGRLYLRQLY